MITALDTSVFLITIPHTRGHNQVPCVDNNMMSLMSPQSDQHGLAPHTPDLKHPQ